MNTGINKNALIKNKGKTAFLFLLAALMLVVSCPFKRLLQAENNLPASTHQSIKGNNAERQGSQYKNISCCAQKQQITIAKSAISKQQLPATDFLESKNFQHSFAIYYFLNGTDKHYSYPVTTSISSSSLFLQHRRLLI